MTLSASGTPAWNALDGQPRPYSDSVYSEVAIIMTPDTSRSRALEMLYKRLPCWDKCRVSVLNNAKEHYGDCERRNQARDWRRLVEAWRGVNGVGV